jgi:DNA-binding Lrp family transcriptional regulator
MSVGTFSIAQIPYKKTNTIVSLQDKMVDAVSQPMSVRTYSWNLSNLSPGEDLWKTYPQFFYGDSTLRIIAPTPDFVFSLEPTFEPFRSLSTADIKILDYLALQGSFSSVNDLSKSISVSSHQISRRLKEYETNHLLLKTNQFFNIALDLSVFFFISSETKEIPWIQHFLSFPKVDVYSQEQESPYYYFGHVKIPNKWIKPFARKIDRIRKEFGIKCYYKIFTPVDHFRYSISLNETYK